MTKQKLNKLHTNRQFKLIKIKKIVTTSKILISNVCSFNNHFPKVYNQLSKIISNWNFETI